MNPLLHPLKTSADSALAAVAMATPWWASYLESGLAIYMALGGAILLALRLGVAWREFRKGRKLNPCKAEPPKDYNQ